MDLLAEQCGIATRKQLYTLGVTRSRVDARIRASAWQTLSESVIATHNGPLTAPQTRWAAVLSAPGLVALAGLTAFDQHGVKGFETNAVHILVPKSTRVPRLQGVEVVVHESRRFTRDDILQRSPPVVRIERAAVDAAVWAPDLKTAARILVAPIQQRKVGADWIRPEFDRAGQVRYRRALHLFLVDLEGGADALSEVEFLRWCRRHRLPTPATQVRKDSAGRRRYLDAEFDLPLEKLMVEIDGGVHLNLATRWEDTAKDNDVAIARKLTLRFPSIVIYSDDPRAIRQLRDAIATCTAHSTP